MGWHCRLGHANEEYIKRMAKGGMVKGLDEMAGGDLFCEACTLGKQECLPFSGTLPRALQPFCIVHIDLSGKMRTASIGGALYYILITDNCTSYRTIRGLKSKSAEEVQAILDEYESWAEAQSGDRIGQYTLDGGTEFLNSGMEDRLGQKGFEFQITAPGTAQQNPRAERGNKTLKSKARTAMIAAGIPRQFWLEICTAIVYLNNRTITTALSLNKTPFEAFRHAKPSVGHVQTLGCAVYRLVAKANRDGAWDKVSSK